MMEKLKTNELSLGLNQTLNPYPPLTFKDDFCGNNITRFNLCPSLNPGRCFTDIWDSRFRVIGSEFLSGIRSSLSPRWNLRRCCLLEHAEHILYIHREMSIDKSQLYKTSANRNRNWKITQIVAKPCLLGV